MKALALALVIATPAFADTMPPTEFVPETAKTLTARMVRQESKICRLYDIKGCQETYAACVRKTLPTLMPHGRIMLWQTNQVTSKTDTICNRQIVDANSGATFR
jgi:hypothetical protein